MTGTPLDLTPFGPLLSALGLIYWALALAIAGLALWLPKSWFVKVPLAAVAIVAFVLPVARHVEQKEVQQDEAKKKLEASMALFNERCKTAGEKINRTVENVEGVVWMKWRDQKMNDHDQFLLDDPYGKDCSGKDCIANLLRVTAGWSLNEEEARLHAIGYAYVESIDPTDGINYRYVGVIKTTATRTTAEIAQYKQNTRRDVGADVYGFALERQPIEKLTARYGIVWDDISTREDREHWIAGGAVRLIDLNNNEVIAERVGYMIDRGQGSTAGFRSPWPWAQYYGPFCPKLEPIKNFATKVVSPKRDQ